MNSISFISENETCMVVLNIALGHNTQMNQTLLIWGLWGGWGVSWRCVCACAGVCVCVYQKETREFQICTAGVCYYLSSFSMNTTTTSTPLSRPIFTQILILSMIMAKFVI